MDRHSMSKSDGSEELLWPGTAAKMLGVAPRTLQRWAEGGKFPSVQLPSGRRRFRRSDVENLLAADGDAPAEPQKAGV